MVIRKFFATRCNTMYGLLWGVVILPSVVSFDLPGLTLPL